MPEPKNYPSSKLPDELQVHCPTCGESMALLQEQSKFICPFEHEMTVEAMMHYHAR